MVPQSTKGIKPMNSVCSYPLSQLSTKLLSLFLVLLCLSHISVYAEPSTASERAFLTRRGFLSCSIALGAFGAIGNLEGDSAEETEPRWNSDEKTVEITSRARLSIEAMLDTLPGIGVNLSVAKLVDLVNDLVRQTEDAKSGGADKIKYMDTAIKASLVTIAKVLISANFPSTGNSGTDSDHYQRMLINPKLFTWSTVVIGPVIEETLFRLVPASVLGKRWSIGVLTSLLFASVHGLERVPVSQFLGGVFYWYLMKERGIDHSIFAHATNNNALAVANFLSQKFP